MIFTWRPALAAVASKVNKVWSGMKYGVTTVIDSRHSENSFTYASQRGSSSQSGPEAMTSTRAWPMCGERSRNAGANFIGFSSVAWHQSAMKTLSRAAAVGPSMRNEQSRKRRLEGVSPM